MANANPQTDNSWIWWTVGGVVTAAAIVGVAIVASRPQVSVTQRTIVGPDGQSRTVTRRQSANNLTDLNISLFHF